MAQRSWLDALTDGQILRDWISLFGSMWFSLFYVVLLAAGYSVGISLSFILIGLPLLLFVLAGTRALAAMDRKLMAAIIGIDDEPDTPDDIDARGANLGERLGMYLGSATTWRSLLYLALKLPISILAFIVSMLILLPLALEVLILAPLTIDMRLFTVRLLHFSAVRLHKLNAMALPSPKTKRRFSRLETVEEPVVEREPRYVIDDDGEIYMEKRKV
jgi:hypothetical protein